jgi:hypothetical protein
MDLVARDDGWRIPDEVWEQIEPLLPERPPHPLACHNPRVPDRESDERHPARPAHGDAVERAVGNGDLLCSSAYRRFREWAEAGVFLELWRRGLLAYDAKHGIEWEWLALDGALGKAPLGGAETGPNPTARAKRGETVAPHRGSGRPARHRIGRCERQRLQADESDARVDRDQAAQAHPEAAGTLSRPRLRLRRGARTRGGVRLHLPYPFAQRGAGAQARGRFPRTALGGRAHALLASPLPPHPRALGEAGRHLPGDAPPRMRAHRWRAVSRRA